jgi:hypothetical protein
MPETLSSPRRSAFRYASGPGSLASSGGGGGLFPLLPHRYDVLGFDLDHALLRYRLPPLLRLIYASLVRSLGEVCGYDRAIFRRPIEGLDAPGPAPAHAAAYVGEAPWVGEICDAVPVSSSSSSSSPPPFPAPFAPHFLHKGLVFDFRTGDLLKFDSEGRLTTGWHGVRPLTPSDLAARYGPERIWPDFHLLREQRKHEAAFVLITYFDIASQITLCQCVQALDEKEERERESTGVAAPCPSRYLHLQRDHVSAFNHMYDNVEAFDTGRGGFFAGIRDSPSLYLVPRPRLAAWLRRLRAETGTLVYLATNSHIRFATHGLEHVLGADWRSCFDLVIFNSLKPSFFARLTPFHALDADRRSDGPVVGHVRLTVPLRPGPGVSLAARPPPQELCQGNAACVQALADAVKWLRTRAARGVRGGGGSSNTAASDGLVTVTAHVDERGHVLRVTASAAGDAVGSVPLTVPLPPRVAKGAPQHEMSGTVTGAPAHVSAKEGKGEEDHLHVHVHDSAAAPPPPPPPPHPHTEPAVVASLLTDELAEPVDEATGAPLEMGGAEGRHPGHARTLYVGDHMHGDVVAAVRECEFDAVAVVEEAEVGLPCGADVIAHHAEGAGGGGEEMGEGEVNWPASYASLCPWGSFFAGGRADGDGRSWFCRVLEGHTVAVVADVESLVGYGGVGE